MDNYGIGDIIYYDYISWAKIKNIGFGKILDILNENNYNSIKIYRISIMNDVIVHLSGNDIKKVLNTKLVEFLYFE